MAVVYDGNNNATNLTTRSAEEIAGTVPFGVLPNQAAISGSGNASQSRLSLAGLLKGGSLFGGQKTAASGPIQVNSLPSDNVQDWRVKISVSKASGVLYNAPEPGILKPLLNTDGVIFPYTPTLTIQHAARYNTQPLTHSNYNNYFYEGSEVQAIQINADFTVQNDNEAAYFLAAVYFFRAATKMFYGDSEQYRGAPPPIVYLDGYGAHYLPHISCVVTGFSHTMPNDVDYVETKIGLGARGTAANPATPVSNSIPGIQGGMGALSPPSGSASNMTTSGFYSTRVPTASTLSVTLQPVYSRTNQRAFNFDAFARGEMIVGSNRTTGYI